jgi:putative component of toxin-antitoxin plasmid stabilization module
MTVVLCRYVTNSDKEVFGAWLEDLADERTTAKVSAPVLRVSAGNSGDCKSLPEGVCASSEKPDLRIRCTVNNDIEIVTNADKVFTYQSAYCSCRASISVTFLLC